MNDEREIRSYRRAITIPAGTLFVWGILIFGLNFVGELFFGNPTKYDEITSAYLFLVSIVFIFVGVLLFILSRRHLDTYGYLKRLAIIGLLLAALLFWGAYFSGFANVFYKFYEAHFYEPTWLELEELGNEAQGEGDSLQREATSKEEVLSPEGRAIHENIFYIEDGNLTEDLTGRVVYKIPDNYLQKIQNTEFDWTFIGGATYIPERPNEYYISATSYNNDYPLHCTITNKIYLLNTKTNEMALFYEENSNNLPSDDFRGCNKYINLEGTEGNNLIIAYNTLETGGICDRKWLYPEQVWYLDTKNPSVTKKFVIPSELYRSAVDESEDCMLTEIYGWTNTLTYKSAKYGFRFKYPGDWKIVEYGGEIIIENNTNESEFVDIQLPSSNEQNNVISLATWVENSEWPDPRPNSELWGKVNLTTGLPAVQNTGDITGSVILLLNGSIYHIRRWNGFEGGAVANRDVFWGIVNSFNQI